MQSVVFDASVKCAPGTGREFQASVILQTQDVRFFVVPVETFWSTMASDEIEGRLRGVAPPESCSHGPCWDWVVTAVRREAVITPECE